MNRCRNTGWIRRTALAALCSGTLLAGSCSQYMDEFRAASSTSFRSGFDALADGIVAGAFAVFEPEDDATSADDSTGRLSP